MFGSLTKQILRLINHFLSSFCADARKLILQISFVMLTDKWEQKAKFFKSPPTSDATLLALHPRILKSFSTIYFKYPNSGFRPSCCGSFCSYINLFLQSSPKMTLQEVVKESELLNPMELYHL